jgi:hypothetical protein
MYVYAIGDGIVYVADRNDRSNTFIPYISQLHLLCLHWDCG